MSEQFEQPQKSDLYADMMKFMASEHAQQLPPWFDEFMNYFKAREQKADQEHAEQDQRGFGEPHEGDAHSEPTDEVVGYETLISNLKDLAHEKQVPDLPALAQAVNQKITTLVNERAGLMDISHQRGPTAAAANEITRKSEEITMWSNFRDTHLRDHMMHLGIIKNDLPG